MASSIFCIMSQVEHTSKCNSIDSENNTVKQNTDYYNYLTWLHVTFCLQHSFLWLLSKALILLFVKPTEQLLDSFNEF